MAELKIGDEGETTNDGERYLIVAEHWRGGFIAELRWGDKLLVYHAVNTSGKGFGGLQLLPPKPKTETLRRWLCMSRTLLMQHGHDNCPENARPADITYTPDGRIVAIVFVDERAEPMDRSDDLKTFHDWLTSPERFAEWQAAAGKDAEKRGLFVTGDKADAQGNTQGDH